MRGYFGIGVEGISKPMNMGSLIRSGHAFGASFAFTVDANYKVREARSDTSKTPKNIPWYDWDNLEDMILPRHCQLVGLNWWTKQSTCRVSRIHDARPMCWALSAAHCRKPCLINAITSSACRRIFV